VLVFVKSCFGKSSSFHSVRWTQISLGVFRNWFFFDWRRLILSKTASNTDFEAGSRKGRAAKSNNQPERKCMSNLNVTVLMGRLVRAPIIRNNRRYRDKAEVAQEETAFVACKCFGGWTDALARHQKGDMVMVEGRLRTETWNNEGTSRSQLILVCDSVQFVVPEPRPQSPSKPNNGDEHEHATPPTGGEADGRPPF
jgi:single-stranded DNA-binding protein